MKEGGVRVRVRVERVQAAGNKLLDIGRPLNIHHDATTTIIIATTTTATTTTFSLHICLPTHTTPPSPIVSLRPSISIVQPKFEGLAGLSALVVTAISLEVGTWDHFFATTSEDR